MSAVATWGKLLIETDVDRLVMLRLREWLPTYLAQAERERVLPGRLLARPEAGSFQNVLEDDDFPDGKLPLVLVTTARTTEAPQKGRDEAGDDRWAAAWRVRVSVVVRGRTAPETREVAAVFGGCVRRVLLQQQIDLEGEVWWLGGSVAPIADASDGGRWLAAGVNDFAVLADVVVSGSGPVLPSVHNPYPAPNTGAPDAPYDPLAPVRQGGVTTTITPRS